MRRIALAPVVAAALLCVAALPASASNAKENETMASHPYIGMWVTEDGRVRQELKSDGRYDEARGSRQSAYQGRYEIDGDTIRYWDDTGFTADGRFIDGVLHHGGMIFYREELDR